MSSSQVRERIAALRSDAQALGELIAGQAASMSPDELFEVTGELQGVLNAGEGAQLVAAAHAASHETRLTDRGPVEVHHGLGFVDAMAASEVSLATGVGQWVAGRRVSLAAALSERFPLLLGQVMSGALCTGTVAKVVSVCEGLDAAACAAVEAVLVDRLADLDPARVSAVTRRVATRVAAAQMRAAHRRNRRDRFVETRPGPDGTTSWWAQLPAAQSAAAWSAITTLGEEYAQKDPSLTTDQARADALLDLLLRNVTVSAKVTLGIPVITDNPATTDPTTTTDPAEAMGPGAAGDGVERAPAGDGVEREPAVDGAERAPAVGGQGLGAAFKISAAFSGCEVPGIGFIDADTIETLLATVPLEVGRALLDARTGTLLETTSTAYRPPTSITDFVKTRDGTCRMWGCDRPALTCDLDHVRPWPAGDTTPANLGDLCRRHHRLKQRGRWAYELHPDGTVVWTAPSGRQRTTLPDHAIWPPHQPPPESVEPVAVASPGDDWGPPPF